MVDAPEIRLELPPEVVFERSLDRSDVRVARIVNDHVNPTVPTDGGFDRCTRSRPVRYVQRERQNTVAVLMDQSGQFIWTTRGSDDTVPCT
jgi:hypothetical protein